MEALRAMTWRGWGGQETQGNGNQTSLGLGNFLGELDRKHDTRKSGGKFSNKRGLAEAGKAFKLGGESMPVPTVYRKELTVLILQVRRSKVATHTANGRA